MRDEFTAVGQSSFLILLVFADVELTMFEIEYSEYAKDKYVEIVNYYKGLGENNELEVFIRL